MSGSSLIPEREKAARRDAPRRAKWLLLITVLTLGCRREPEPEPRERATQAQPCGRVVHVETDEAERSRVFVTPAAGGPSAPLTAEPIDPEGSTYPVAQSPDGRTLLLLSSREVGDGTTRDRLWLADLERSPVTVRPLPVGEVEQQIRSPTWAPDGRWLAFEGSANSFRDLYRVELDSGAVLRLTDDPEGNFEPAISPDGQAIAFVSSRDGNAEIYVMSSDGGDPRRLTRSPGDDSGPRWSPDGRTIAFLSSRARERGIDVYRMDRDGNEQRPLLGERNESIVASQLEFSPDGSRLAFTELVPGRGTAAIVIVEPERGEVTARIAGDGVFEQPSWSPDGRFLAFARSEGGRSAIARARVDGSELVSLTDGAGERWLPRWIADPQCPRVDPPISALAGAG